MSHIRGIPLLGDHFSPLLGVLLAPAWWLWPDPRALLLLQAGALAGTVYTVGRFTAQRISQPAAIAATGACLLSGLVINGAYFDFHEVAVAAPLVAWLTVSTRCGNRAAALVASVLLLLVKEDLGLTVIAAGATWWLVHRDRRTAMTLAALGCAGLVLAVVVVSSVNPDGQSNYLSNFGIGHPAPGPRHEGGWSWTRLAPLALFTLSTGVVGWRSPLAVIALPTLMWRTLSSNPNYWSVDYHYDLVLWPIALLALIDALALMSTRHRRYAAIFAIVGLVASALYAAGVIERKVSLPLRTHTTALTDVSELTKAHVPTGAPISTDGSTGVYLVPKYDVYRLSAEVRQTAQFIAFRWDRSNKDYPLCAKRRLVALAHTHSWHVWNTGDAVLIKTSGQPWDAPSCATDHS